MSVLSEGRLAEIYATELHWSGCKKAALRAVVEAAIAADRAARAEPLTTTYVQPVPDHCDRITWRGRYFHLPIISPAAAIVSEGWKEVMDMLTGFDPIMMTSSSYGGKVFRVELGFRNFVERNNGHDFLQKIIHLRGKHAAAPCLRAIKKEV